MALSKCSKALWLLWAGCRKPFVLLSLANSQEKSALVCLTETDLLSCLCKHWSCAWISAARVCLSGCGNHEEQQSAAVNTEWLGLGHLSVYMFHIVWIA